MVCFGIKLRSYSVFEMNMKEEITKYNFPFKMSIYMLVLLCYHLVGHRLQEGKV